MMRAEKITLLLPVAALLLLAWLLVGCKGEEGPAGPPGPGLSGEAMYAGDDATTCGHCHSNLVESWHGTHHSEAWSALGADTTNLYCVQCHTTGFDDRYDFAGNRVSSGVNNGGFDDTHDPKLKNVQCEACHGPMGVNPAAHTPVLAANFSGESCSKCHEQYAEWTTSVHGSAFNTMTPEEFYAEWGRSSCDYCHISEGFIKKFDPDQSALTYDAETVNMIGCATCHDAHSAANASQLRTLASVTTPYGGEDEQSGHTITGFGAGQLCVQCHHARPTRSSIQGQINNGNAHPGPHHSCQGDMVSGRGCWETPGTYVRENPHVGTLENMCVDCHMFSIPHGQTGGPLYGHSFAPDVRKCQGCHAGATNFDIHGIQTEIEAKLEELAALLPHDSTGAVMAAMDTVNWTHAQREAGYTYFFVENDGSMGVHNPPYADSLLTNAIRYLTPGALTERRPGVRG
jgi:hypothetical protein